MIALALTALLYAVTLGLPQGHVTLKNGLTVRFKRAPWWRWVK